MSESHQGRPAAKPPLGLWMATALVVGSMIGSGVFLLPAQLEEREKPHPWVGGDETPVVVVQLLDLVQHLERHA